MIKNISLVLMAFLSLSLSGCVTKMIGGAVDIVTFGIVKNDVKETKVTNIYKADKVDKKV